MFKFFIEISPHDRFFSTDIICDICDKYELCPPGRGTCGCRTPNQIRVTLLCHGVTEILTRHGMSKMDFEPDFRNPQMHSFPNMCNTMRSKMDGLAVREHFLSKNAEKTAFLGLTILDQLTSERASTHNFRD